VANSIHPPDGGDTANCGELAKSVFRGFFVIAACGSTVEDAVVGTWFGDDLAAANAEGAGVADGLARLLAAGSPDRRLQLVP
jgi:hypothetical protein